MGKEKKQFPLDSKENCCIYLCRIIFSCELCDKTYNVLSYLLNLLGDCQSSSISYFKYRQQIQKKNKSRKS